MEKFNEIAYSIQFNHPFFTKSNKYRYIADNIRDFYHTTYFGTTRPTLGNFQNKFNKIYSIFKTLLYL